MTKARSFRRSAVFAAAFLLLAVFAWGCQAPQPSAGIAPDYSAAPASESAGAGEYPSKSVGYTEEVPPDSRQAVYTERQMIQRAELALRVSDANEASKKAQSLLEKAGGFVESSSIENRTGERPIARMTLRVPSSKLTSILDALEELGTRLRRSVSREDVTTQLVDMEVRLRNLRAQEDALREIFRRATKVADVMEVQRRLAEVRTEIEALEAHRAQMRELVALSTIELTLDESAASLAGTGDPGWFKEGWASATDAFQSFLREMALFGVWLAVFSPIWLPFALWIAWLFVRSARRARSREVVSEPPAQA